jgi:phosphoenolpyruvate---glycerone phosphotransferase subunit DhaL
MSAGATLGAGSAGAPGTSSALGFVTSRGVAVWLRAFAAAVAEQRDNLTELDAAIGDGDHGINMDRGMQAVVAKLNALGAGGVAGAGEAGADGAGGGPAQPSPPDDVGALLKAVGMTLVSTVGGAAGPLYGTLFLEMGKAAAGQAELSPAHWAEAFAAGVAGVQARGKAEPDDKTMIDALAPAAAALRAAAAAGLSPAASLRQAAAAAEQGMKATISLVARKGRASYLGERSAGHQDPGATSSWLLLKTAAEVFAAAGGAAPAPDPAGARP